MIDHKSIYHLIIIVFNYLFLFFNKIIFKSNLIFKMKFKKVHKLLVQFNISKLSKK